MLTGTSASAPTTLANRRLHPGGMQGGLQGGLLVALVAMAAAGLMSGGSARAAPAAVAAASAPATPPATPSAAAPAASPRSASAAASPTAVVASASGGGDQAYFLHASACVAAIKQDVMDRVAVYQPAQPVQREDILRLTEQSFAFVGTAYKLGLRNPQAKQLLDDAEQRHARLAPPAQRRLSQQCQVEGARLVAEANVLERMLVRNRAAARVSKLLPPVSNP